MLGERLNDGLSVLRVGTGDGPALVYLPGLGEVADLAEEVPAVLARSAKSVAMGSGRTVHMICRPKEMPAGTSVADLAGWHAVALRERFDEPVDVMGTSAGGIIALQLAVDHGDVLRRVVVSVAASRISDRGRRDLLRGVELEREGKSSAWISSGLVAHGPLRLLAAAAYRGGRHQRRTPGEAVLIEAVQQWDVTGRLGEVTTPTLVISGTRDPLIPVGLAEATSHGIAGGRLELLEGRGHATTLLDPRSMRAAQAFLDEPSPPPPAPTSQFK